MSGRRSAGIAIGHLGPDDIPKWDDFVENQPGATFFHRAGWKGVIEKSFGHRCHFLYASRRGEISGVLPLTHIKSRLFGNTLISNAFCVYGGPVAAEASALEALNDAAMDLAHRLKVDYLEYRSRSPGRPDWLCNAELYATFRGKIETDAEKALLAIPRKRRAEIRKGLSSSLTRDIGQDVARFYPIYAESVRNLGTPVYGRGYFENLIAAFASQCDVLTVSHAGTPLSSVLSFYFRDQVLPYYAGSVSAARSLGANDHMYWALMRHATDRGIRVFDFGRSKRRTGAFDYKKNWGFEPERLYYEYFPFKRKEIPAVNPINPVYRPLVRAWQQLPLALANNLGPRIARNLG